MTTTLEQHNTDTGIYHMLQGGVFCDRGKIADDRSFYYGEFPAPPSKSAKIKYKVSFTIDYVDIHIYTTKDHINLKK